MDQQLELLPKSAVAVAPKNSRTPEWEAWYQAKILELREERSEQEAIGHQLYPDFMDIRDCPLGRLRTICDQWRESKGYVVAEIIHRVRPIAPQPPLRQWSTLAKHRKRLANLHKRLKKKYTFPEFFHQAIQEQVLTNPDYYGVCPLPSEFACKYFPPNLRRIAAIEQENHRRRLGI